MRLMSYLAIPLALVLADCGQTTQHPEVSYRQCMLEQARVAAREREPTYEDALRFNRKCEYLALQAATQSAREELGDTFERRTPTTMNAIRKNLHQIVNSHVCALASDRPREHCLPIM
jgi:hypothetical protein